MKTSSVAGGEAMPSILIESAKLIVHDELATDSALGHGVIKRNTALKSPIRAGETIHANRIALGALIDAHVHIGDMQLEHKNIPNAVTSGVSRWRHNW